MAETREEKSTISLLDIATRLPGLLLDTPAILRA
jgi:hypothetical protein